jgi:glycolate oxidase FAD binding subunit
VLGRGSKRALGRPVQASRNLDLSALTGITLYEAEELVLSARAGTPLAEIEAVLAEKHQQLAFEPGDLGPLFGAAAGRGSIGGMLACNLAGSRRIKAGAARDHFLGATAVSGRGEAFKAGGRVVKNVTGYDLCKLLAGSHGTLALMTDVTVKVMPAPEKTRTVLLLGLDDPGARAAMTRALQSSHEVSGAAHLPAAIAARSAVSYVARAGGAVTVLRVEGPGPSVDYRCAALREDLADLAESEELHSMNSAALWRELRDVAPFAGQPERPLWRVYRNTIASQIICYPDQKCGSY